MKLTTKKMTMIAVLTALATILKIVINSLNLPYKFVFHNIPIMIISIFFNPLYGVLSALICDLVSIVSTPNWNPLFTIPQLFWGLIPGLFFLRKKELKIYKLIITEYVSYFTVSFSNFLVFWITISPSYAIGRLPNTLIILLIKAPIDIIILHFLNKNLFSKKENLFE